MELCLLHGYCTKVKLTKRILRRKTWVQSSLFFFCQNPIFFQRKFPYSEEKQIFIKLTEEKCPFINMQQRRKKEMSVQKAVKREHYEAESNMEQDIVRKAWVFKPSGLNFIWGGDSRYWVIPKEDGTPAELKMVSWLEVTGSYDKIEPGKTYRIGFKISFTADATGWEQAPLFMSAKVGKKGKTIWKRIKSVNNNIEKLKGGTGPVNIPDETDGRLEVFVSPNLAINQDTKLQFGLYEVWTGKWKKGLLIYEAFVEEV